MQNIISKYMFENYILYGRHRTFQNKDCIKLWILI